MRALGTKSVLITPGARKPGREALEVEAHVQAAKAYFDVTTPVYEGDTVEWDDPRGDRRTAYVRAVKVNDAGGDLAELAHIAVEFTDDRPDDASRIQSDKGHTIHVRGNNINIAVNGSTITQQLAVTPEWQKLANAIGRSLAVIEDAGSIDSDEVEVARDAASVALEELANDQPDASVVKRALPALRGVLQSAANAGASALASGLMGQLFI
jgi:hypothetical protein